MNFIRLGSIVCPQFNTAFLAAYSQAQNPAKMDGANIDFSQRGYKNAGAYKPHGRVL